MLSLTYRLKYWIVTPMGDAADDLRDMEEMRAMEYWDTFGICQNLSDEDLRVACAETEDPKIKDISEWPGPLSEKQRWCLCNWVALNDWSIYP